MENKKIGIVIADSDTTYTGNLKSYIDSEENMEVSRIVSSGDLVNAALEETGADVLIMDIILPVLDGFFVLRQLEKLSKRPSLVIVASVIGHELLVRKAAEAGADYYVLKPLNYQTFVERIKFLSNIYVSKDSCRENRDLSATVPILSFPTASAVSDGPLIIEKPILNVKKETTRLLHEIGVPANLKGHNYLRDAVLMVLEDRKLINSVTKTIYPSIGQRYDTSACSVERAIRTALETAWTRGKTEILNNLFGFTVNINKGKPTNAEFIALIADKLSLDCS
jgi:two-component system response regulator (stage 0 sporulation protein A)